MLPEACAGEGNEINREFIFDTLNLFEEGIESAEALAKQRFGEDLSHVERGLTQNIGQEQKIKHLRRAITELRACA